MPSQRHVVSSTVHDVHQSKEPLGMIILSHFTLSRVGFLFNNAWLYECFLLLLEI